MTQVMQHSIYQKVRWSSAHPIARASVTCAINSALDFGKGSKRGGLQGPLFATTKLTRRGGRISQFLCLATGPTTTRNSDKPPDERRWPSSH